MKPSSFPFMFRALQAAIAACLIASCATTQRDAASDASVLQGVAADPHFAEWSQCSDRRFVIDPRNGPPAYEHDKPYFYAAEKLPRDLLESLIDRNAPLPVVTIPEGEARVWFSLPGYDRSGMAAVAVTRNHVSDECLSAGYIVLLRRSGRRWIVMERTGEWVE